MQQDTATTTVANPKPVINVAQLESLKKIIESDGLFLHNHSLIIEDLNRLIQKLKATETSKHVLVIETGLFSIAADLLYYSKGNPYAIQAAGDIIGLIQIEHEWHLVPQDRRPVKNHLKLDANKIAESDTIGALSTAYDIEPFATLKAISLLSITQKMRWSETPSFIMLNLAVDALFKGLQTNKLAQQYLTLSTEILSNLLVNQKVRAMFLTFTLKTHANESAATATAKNPSYTALQLLADALKVNPNPRALHNILKCYNHLFKNELINQPKNTSFSIFVAPLFHQALRLLIHSNPTVKNLELRMARLSLRTLDKLTRNYILTLTDYCDNQTNTFQSFLKQILKHNVAELDPKKDKTYEAISHLKSMCDYHIQYLKKQATVKPSPLSCTLKSPTAQVKTAIDQDQLDSGEALPLPSSS